MFCRMYSNSSTCCLVANGKSLYFVAMDTGCSCTGCSCCPICCAGVTCPNNAFDAGVCPKRLGVVVTRPCALNAEALDLVMSLQKVHTKTLFLLLPKRFQGIPRQRRTTFLGAILVDKRIVLVITLQKEMRRLHSHNMTRCHVRS